MQDKALDPLSPLEVTLPASKRALTLPKHKAGSCSRSPAPCLQNAACNMRRLRSASFEREHD